MQELENQLREDLLNIGLNVDFSFSLRGYSKSYFGRYDIKSSTIILYVYKNSRGDMYPYEELLLTTIHEAIHCKQWHDPNYKRVRGVMHDLEFKRLYSLYSNRAKARMLFREVSGKYDSSYKNNVAESYSRVSVCC